MSALTSCLQEEAAAIAAAATRLDTQQVELALSQLEGCRQRRAKLVLTGVGKSGIVARKIAATFSSIGLTAVFLNPVDALHGDLGIVASDDVALLLSNSGETEELLAILPHLTQGSPRRRGLRAGWVHHGNGLLRRAGLITDGDLRRTLQHYEASAWGLVTAAQIAIPDPITVTLEVHPDPDNGLSDGPNMVPLHRLEALLVQLLAIRAAVAEGAAVSTL